MRFTVPLGQDATRAQSAQRLYGSKRDTDIRRRKREYRVDGAHATSNVVSVSRSELALAKRAIEYRRFAHGRHAQPASVPGAGLRTSGRVSLFTLD